MKHEDIKKMLSAYIENDLQANEQVLVEEHLKSCVQCRKSNTELIKVIEGIKSVGEVEPPPYLTQKIMATIKEEAAKKKGVLQWLLYPLHVKLPIEIAVTVIVAVTAVYVYHDGKPEFKLTEMPMHDIAEHSLSREKEEVHLEDERMEMSAPALPLTKEYKKKNITKQGAEEPQKFAPIKGPEVHKTKSLEMPPSPVHKDEGDKIGLTAKEPEKAASSNLTGTLERKPMKTIAPLAPEAREDNKGISSVSAGKTALKEENSALESNVNSLVAEQKKAVTVIALKVQNREYAKQEIEKILITTLHAKITKTDFHENLTIISVRLEANKMKALILQLRQLGEMKEKDVSLDAYEGEREISIQIETKTTTVR